MFRARDKAGFKALLAAMTLALVAVACGGASDANSGSNGGGSGQALTGKIVTSGSSTVEPITSLGAELFSEENPDVGISVDGPGTGDGFELFCQGKTQLEMM